MTAKIPNYGLNADQNIISIVVSIEDPEEGIYPALLASPVAWTLQTVRAITASGTCSVQAVVNDSPVGSAVSTSSTLNTGSPSAAIAQGQSLDIDVTSITSAERLVVQLTGTLG